MIVAAHVVERARDHTVALRVGTRSCLFPRAGASPVVTRANLCVRARAIPRAESVAPLTAPAPAEKGASADAGDCASASARVADAHRDLGVQQN